nr:tyrosine-type recombinase/integrase [Facklamia miroungae]
MKEEFLIDCKIRNLSPRTIETYDRNIAIVISLLKNKEIYSVEKVSKVAMNEVILYLKESGRKTSYINTILKSIKVLFKYAYEERYISENIMLKVNLLKEEKLVLTTFSDEEVIKMIDYYSGKGFLKVRNKLIIEMFADTGLRASELRGIRNNRVKDGYLIVCGKGNKERIVPLSPYLGKRIIKYKRVKYDYFKNLRVQRELDDFLFLTKSGNMIRSNVLLELVVKEAAISVGVREEVKRKSCHSLRHYYAQNLLKSGTNMYIISRLLGHSNLKTTQLYLNSLTDEEIINHMSENTPLMQMVKKLKRN